MAGWPDVAWWLKSHLATEVLWLLMHINESGIVIPQQNGSRSILCVCVWVTTDAMFKYDSDVDVDANANVKCEQSLRTNRKDNILPRIKIVKQ